MNWVDVVAVVNPVRWASGGDELAVEAELHTVGDLCDRGQDFRSTVMVSSAYGSDEGLSLVLEDVCGIRCPPDRGHAASPIPW